MKKQVVASSAFLWKKPQENAVWTRLKKGDLLAPPVVSAEEAQRLYEERLVDSEVVFGTVVEVVAEEGEWSQVLVLDQASDSAGKGYPGYLATAQLTEEKAVKNASAENFAVIAAATPCRIKQTGEERTLLFGTVVPVVQKEKDYYVIETVAGQAEVAQEALQPIGAAGQVERMIQHAKQFLALPYVWAGTSSCGFDCSGFMYALHRTEGIELPRDAEQQALAGKEIPYSEALPGDLVLFAYEEGQGAVHHVGMFLGEDQMIHSETPGSEVKIGPLRGTKFERELCTVRRYWQK